jgi:Fe-Mn family superoxide dismutase
MKFELPKLKYEYDELEPYIDAKTMEIHHSKHHQGYTNNLNAALEKFPEYEFDSIEGILTDIDSVPNDIKTAVINNGGGYYNHKLFWETMSPDPQKKPEGKLLESLMERFGSFDEFKEKFNEVASTRFGSGWAWLVLKEGNVLEVYSTKNQDSPLLYKEVPLLGLDVWEHAYYLKYQNKRPEYIKNWWNVVNWAVVEELYDGAIERNS